MVLIKSKPETMRHAGVFPHGFNSILNSFFEDSKIETQNIHFMPQADIVEMGRHYEIRLSLPGMSKEDVKISLDGELLTVEGERKQAAMEEGSRFLKREIRYGKFSRSFSMNRIDSAKIEAEFINGVLSITLPKLAEEKVSTIAIK
jgi:HSP20 family protein